jgi:hypothetical protein
MEEAYKTDPSGRVTLMRLRPNKDSVLEYKWVPELFRKLAATPLATESWACPWLLYSAKFGYRFGTDKDPFPGVGAFCLGVTGETTLVMWPMADTLAAKTALGEVSANLQRLSAANARKYMANAAWVAIQEPVCGMCACRVVANGRGGRLPWGHAPGDKHRAPRVWFLRDPEFRATGG